MLGEKLHPLGADPLAWEELDATDGVYFTAGDEAALGQARRAGVLVATARELPTLRSAGVELDALVASARGPAERYEPGELDPPPRLVVSTAARSAVGGAGRTGRRVAGRQRLSLGRSRTPTAPATASPPA